MSLERYEMVSANVGIPSMLSIYQGFTNINDLFNAMMDSLLLFASCSALVL